MRYYYLAVFLIAGAASLSAQPGSEQRYDWKVETSSLEEAFYELTELTGIPISFSNTALPRVSRVTHSFQQKKLEEILDVLLNGTDFYYEWVGRQVLILRIADNPIRKYSLSGYVHDGMSGEPLIGANIFSLHFAKGTTTNAYGYYSLTLAEGPVEIVFSYLGYKQRTLPLELFSNQIFNIELQPSVTLEEVLVTAPAIPGNTMNASPGKHTFRAADMDNLPSLSGEPDVLRLAYLLPGVLTGADGFGGLSVRGGGVDQNLVLLDGVPVYNATHFVGIFSIFNSSAIRSAQLIKGVFPARYGGRTSSVLDVRTKEGNNKEWTAEADLGIASGKAFIEGPLISEKSSVFVGARRSFIDFYSRPFTRQYLANRNTIGQVGYYFYDVNAKVNYRLGYRDHLYGSFYSGGDEYSNDQEKTFVQEDTTTIDKVVDAAGWGNTIGALRWNHLFNDKLFSNTTLTFSRFYFGSTSSYDLESSFPGAQVDKEYLYLRYNSNNRDWAMATDFDYRPHPDHTLRFGGSAVLHRFQPGGITFDESYLTDSLTEEGIRILLERNAQLAREYDLYIEDEFQVRREFGGNIGFRTTFLHVNGELLYYLQPRFQLFFRPHTDLLLSIGVGRSVQPLQLLTNSGSGLPVDLWVSSTRRIRPVDSWQISASAAWSGFKDWELSLEGFYKYMDNLITFQEGTLVAIDATNWQNKVAVGEGWSYGAEWMLKRTGKRFSGWAAYTLSWSKRRFEEVNLGESFPFRFDRRHSLHLAGALAMGKRWKASAVWTFGTGAPTSLPRSSYQFNQFNLLYSDVPPQFPFIVDVPNYGRKNDIRLPAYHRLDLELQYTRKNTRAEHQFSIGAYNVYNRFNPIYYRVGKSPDDNGEYTLKYLKVALLPTVPTLRYRLQWAVFQGKKHRD